jgi:hypothetical protein
MDSAEAIASSAVEMALDMKARAIICFTVTGRSAPLLAKYRPPMQTFIVSPEDHVVKACRAFSCLQGIPMEFQGMEVRPPFLYFQGAAESDASSALSGHAKLPMVGTIPLEVCLPDCALPNIEEQAKADPWAAHCRIRCSESLVA